MTKKKKENELSKEEMEGASGGVKGVRPGEKGASFSSKKVTGIQGIGAGDRDELGTKDFGDVTGGARGIRPGEKGRMSAEKVTGIQGIGAGDRDELGTKDFGDITGGTAKRIEGIKGIGAGGTGDDEGHDGPDVDPHKKSRRGPGPVPPV